MSSNRRFHAFLTGSFCASFGGWIHFLAILSASTALQSTGMFMQFIAPSLGALLTSYLSTSDVFLVLGTLSALCLAAVTVRFGKQRHAVTAGAAALPD